MREKHFRKIILLAIAFLFLISFHVEAQPKIKPGEKKEFLDPSLKITSFRINNGAASTTNETVTLNNTVQGDAGEYRASMSQDFQYAQWRTYGTAPTFNLGGGHGTKTIYFQVKSSKGVSNVVSDNIRWEAPPPQPIPGSGTGPGSIVTTPQPYPKIEPPRPPTITSFTINNGAATTTSRFVTLRFTVRGSVTHFRVSQRGDTFPGEEWVIYHENQENYELSAGDGLKTVYLQVKDNLGQVSSVARASITLNDLPSIISFNLLITTTRRAIPLNHTAYGAPTHWRASESQDFSKNLQSGPYTPPLTFTLSEGFGQKTVYFQVMRQMSDNTILYSNIVSRTIDYVPSSGRKNFTISGYDAYEIAKSRAFGFSTIPKDVTSDCRMWGNPGGPLVLEAVTSRVVGSKCDFNLFQVKQLREGWVFKSYGHQKNCIDGRGDSSADQQPLTGSRDLAFKIHVWADPPGNLIGGPSRTICDFFLNSITLEGPENARWQDAF